MKKLEKFFDILGEILAVLLVLVYVVFFANRNWPFLNDIADGLVVKIIIGIMQYGPLLLIAIVGMEAISKRNIVFKIIFLVLLAVVIVFMFLPAASGQIIDWINGVVGAQ